ncbi:MAG: DNA primase [Spirochaetaceae bacterium]|jgi:DNA primase|nr:DNA primase [Spirochaetaceae bacterium]
MPFISRKTIDEIQTRLDPVGIIGEYVRLEQRGGNFWGLCPFHNEKTPSFSVNPERKSWYCFGCHEGGGIVNFVMQVEKISFPEALVQLARKTGVRIEYESDNGAVRHEDENSGREKDDCVELYRRVAGSLHHILRETAEGASALQYVHSRGINNAMIDRFRLGYAPSDRTWLYKFLSGKGYSAAFLAQSGLFSRKYPQTAFFSGRLMFPINDRQGRTVAFGGRILGGDGPKYLNSQESVLYRKREALFALDLALPEIRRTKEALVCEGYMDVIALHQAGVTNAVAPLGTAFTGEQARLLRRWAERIKLLFDTDEAGETAAGKAILVCRQNSVSCAVVRIELPGGTAFKDPADILKDGGESLLSESVKNVMLDSDYLTAKSKSKFLTRRDDTEGISRAIAFLIPFFSSIESEAEKDAFSKQLALVLGVDPSAVQHDLRFGQEKTAAGRRAGEGNTAQRCIAMNEELYVLTAAAVNIEVRPDLFNAVRKNLPAEDFEDRSAKELYLALEECLRCGELRLDALLSRLEDRALRDFVAGRSAGREFSDRMEQIVFDGIRGVKIKHLERRGRRVDTELRLAKNAGQDTADLLLEKQFILDELQTLKGVGYGRST